MTTQPQYTYDLFISYSHADQEWVRGELLPRLEEAGLKVVVDYRNLVLQELPETALHLGASGRHGLKGR